MFNHYLADTTINGIIEINFDNNINTHFDFTSFHFRLYSITHMLVNNRGYRNSFKN